MKLTSREIYFLQEPMIDKLKTAIEMFWGKLLAVTVANVGMDAGAYNGSYLYTGDFLNGWPVLSNGHGSLAISTSTGFWAVFPMGSELDDEGRVIEATSYGLPWEVAWGDDYISRQMLDVSEEMRALQESAANTQAFLPVMSPASSVGATGATIPGASRHRAKAEAGYDEPSTSKAASL